MKSHLEITVIYLFFITVALTQVPQEQVDKKIEEIIKRRQENLDLKFNFSKVKSDLKICEEALKHQKGCPVCPACPQCPVCPNVADYISKIAQLEDDNKNLNEKIQQRDDHCNKIELQNQKLKDLIRKIREEQVYDDEE